MPSRTPWDALIHTRALVLLTVMGLLGTLLAVVVPPPPAAAAGTVLFDNSFYNRTVDGTGTVTKPTPVSGTNAACLTASGNSSTPPLLSCSSSSDVQGSGKLRLTSTATNQVGGVFGSSSFPSSNGLDVTFNTYQYGSTSGADGMSFVLAATDPTNPVAPTTIGPSGGSLGYSPAGSSRGLPNAYLGVGLDVFGNFSSPGYQGTGCPTVANITAQAAGAVVVRGPGNGLVGYCGLTTTYDGTTSSKATLRSSAGRAAAAVPVQVLVNPTTAAFTSTTGVAVPAGQYKVVVTPVGQATKTLSGNLPAAPASLYPATSWVNANGVPRQLSFGFVGATGSVTDFHEASNVKVVTFNQVPELAVSTTSYVVAAPAPGAPVNYVISPTVQTGTAVARPISMTHTTPTGVVPLAAYGSGWTCATPVGQSVTCTTTGSSFASGATLPPINVVAIVTATGVTSTTVQNNSNTTVTSPDSNPGADATTTPGTTPAPPSGVAVSPSSGPVAGGNTVTVTGSSTVGPTAVEIGTTAEFQAGTVTTLLPCGTGDTTECFAISGSAVLVYLPARSSPGTVQVALVTLGVASSASYVYADRPATLATPTATAGLTSATVTWVAPADNGRTISSYVITPYLSGVAQAPVSVDPAAVTRVISGLTAGSSYTFTIAAVNALGTSAASNPSAAVIPYSVINAPTIGTVTAGTSAVTVRWTAPTSTGGSPITGYVVTPYIGTVAQTPRSFSGTATTQTVTGLTPGTAYTFTVAARTSGGTSVLYRVNAGGPLLTAIDGGLNWSADAGTDNPLRNSGSLTTAPGPSATFDSTVPNTTPSAIFDTDRYDPGSKGNGDEMSWAFPVTSGNTVKVRLYFANRYVPTGQPGQRVFDVSLDGSRVLDQFDMVTGAGGDQRGTMREFTLTSDGTVNIDFTHEVENPQINGIEIIQTGVSAVGPPSAASIVATPNTAPTLNFAAPPAGEVNLAYSNQLTVTGGTSPYVWSVSSGALPAGLTLNPSTGLLSGTPTAPGTFNLTVQVVDASGVTTTKAVILDIYPALVVTFVPTAGEVSVPYSYQPVRTGGGGSYTWAVTAGSLPAGVTISASTGLISGTPTASGSFPVTIAVTDALQTVPKTATIVIAPLPAITSGTPAAGQVGVAYSSTFVVSGGTGPFVWSVSAGSLPPGLALDSTTGVLSGTPTTVGSSTFTVLLTDAYGKTATRTVTLVVSAGPLVVVKTANAPATAPGGAVTYTITVTNTSATAISGVALTDPLTGVLDDASYNADAVTTAGTLTYSSSTLGWTGTVPANGAVTITYSVAVTSPGAGNKILANTVSSTTLGTNCGASSTDTRCTAIVTVSGLSIVHTASVPTTTPGSTVTFTTVVTNTGQTSYVGATFTESLAAILDDAAYTGDAGATSGSISYGSQTLSWTGNLAVGASATITYSVIVANPDPGNRSLASTVVSPTAGSTCPSSNPAASCTASVTVLIPALSITNTAGVSTTTPGSTVPYTVVIANTGQTTYSGTSVSIALAAALDDATFNGNAVATTGTVVYTAATGTLVWTGTLAPGTTTTVTAAVTVRDPDPADRVLTSVASSSAPGSTCPVGSSNSACTSTVQVRIPQLTITKSSNVTTTTPGSVVAYTVLVTNSGQTPFTGATFTDGLAAVLDDATYNNNAATTAGAVSFSSPAVNWSGDLPIGASAAITYSVTVQNPDPGDKSMSSRVISTTPGANCPSGSGDTRCTNVVTVLVPALTIGTTTDVSTATPGQVVRYTIAVQNTGQTNYTSVALNLDFFDVYDDATYNNDGITSTGNLQLNPDGSAIWTLNLAPGASATGTTSFTVNPTVTRGRLMKSAVSSNVPGSTCPTGSPSGACRTTVAVLIPELSITKTSDKATVQPGGAVGYTIVVANTGESSYPSASFNDSLAGVVDDATYSGGASATIGTVTYADSNLFWTGALAPGASATITYSVTIRDPDPGDKRLSNTTVSPTAGSNCASGSTDARCTAVVNVLVPGLTIVKTANASSTVPNATVGYSVTVTNSGATPYSGATFADSLGGNTVLDDADYNADAATTSGTVSYANSTLGWTGNLDVGASATITYSVTVHPADGGDNLLSNKVISSTGGSNCATGSVDLRCSVVVPVARLVLERVPVPPATTTPGSVLNLSVRYTNAGKVPYVGIKVDIPRADSSDDLFATGPDLASSGTLVRTDSTTQWTGDIPVGGSVAITIIRTVRDPDTGNKQIRAPLQSDAPGSNCPSVGATDPRCIFLTQVLVPGLSMTKTADKTSVEPGASIGYTLIITNTGQTAYQSALVSDSLVGVLDDATYPGNQTATSGSVAYNASTSTLSWTGNLAVGATATVTYSVVTNNPGTGDKTARNTVSSTAAGSTCPPNSNNPSCTTSTSVLIPALTITKSAATTTTTLGATVAFTVSVANTGQTSYPAASFTDPLAGVLDDASYLPAATTTSSGTTSYSSGVLSWTGALVPGQSATITYSVAVTNPSTGNRILSNTVTSTSTGNNCAVASADPRCTVNVDVLNSVALSIVKTTNVATTVPNGSVTFTLRLTNPTDITITNANVTDNLSGILDDATYTAATANVGVVTFTNPNLTWTGNVAARRTVTITYTVKVGTIGAGDELLTATTVSTSPATSNNCLTGSTDPDCTATVPIAQLALTQTANVPTATPGSAIVVTAVYTNSGQVPFSGISVNSPRADTSDDTVPTGDQTASSGTLVRTATAVTWSGDIPVGGTVTVTRTLVVKDPDPGNQVITATLQSDAPGNNCLTGTTDARCTFTVTVLTPALTVSKTASAAFIQPNGTVGYTITITNSGQAPYSGATVTDNLTGVLDDADYNDNATTTTGAVGYTNPTLTWTGNLAVGQTTTINYTVTSRSPGTGDKAMINAVQSTEPGSTCPPASPNASCRATVAVLTPALNIVKTANLANATLGSTVSYTVMVTNSGQTYYPTASFSDPLAGVLDDAAYQADAAATLGTVEYQSGVLSWTGALIPGQSATITYSVRINNPLTGDRTMVNTLTSSTPGNNCAGGSTDARCTANVTVTNAVALTITKTANVVSTVSGAPVRYSVSVTNSSGLAINSATFSDPLAGLLDDASYDENAVATSGNVSYQNTVLTWTGDVAAGATVTVTYSVTVDNTVAGDLILDGKVSSTSLPESNNCLANSTDPRCRTTVPVARLLIAYGAVQPTAVPGQLLHFTQTYTNTGKVPYVGISVETLAPEIADDANAGVQSASSGTFSVGETGITWTGDIAVGETIYLSADTQVKNPDTGNRLLQATSQSTAPGNNCLPGSSDPLCTFTINVKVPGLTITKSANRTSAAPGEAVAFTITMRNSGETPYQGAVVTDSLEGVLDDGALIGTPTTTAGTVLVDGVTLSWTGDLAIGATATVSYSVTALSTSTGDKWLLNTVTSSATGSSCTADAGAAGCSVQVEVLTPDLTILKSADTDTTTLGAVVTYTIAVTNTGQTTYPAATVSDSLTGVLDDATYTHANTTATRGGLAYANKTLTWTGALTPGQTAAITYTVTLNNPATGDLRLANTATSTSEGNNCTPGSTDNRCTTVVDVINSVALSIVKTANVANTVPGAPVTFTLRLTNPTGTNIIGATFTDNLAGILDDAAYTSATANVGVVTFNSPNLTWTGNVAARRTVNVTYTVSVGSIGAGDELLTAKTVSTSPATSNNCLPGSTDPDCTATVPVAQLTLTQTADEASATPGSVIHLRGTYRNTGQVPYVGITVVSPRADIADDTIPDGNQTASSGTLIRTEDQLIWTGDIPVGGVVTLSRTSTVRDPDPGNKIVTSTLISTAPGNNCATGSTDPRCTFAVAIVTPKLTITKTANTTSVVPDGVVGYTITAANTGETAYLAAAVTDSLLGVLDDATYNADASASTGSLVFASPNLTWTGDLAIGQVVTISFTVTAHRPADGDKTMLNRVSSVNAGSTCPPNSGSAACTNTISVRTPSLTTVVKANKITAVPGDVVSYTVTATNDGQTDYTTATFDAPLGGLLDDATYNDNASATSGTVVRTGDSLVWTGALIQGAQATITYFVTINNAVSGDHQLTQTLTSVGNGSNCLAFSPDPRCTTSVPIASLQIVNSVVGNVLTAKPTDVVRYVGTFTNTGQVPYAGITVADSFVGALDNATYNGDATADSGSLIVVVGSGRIVWTGDVAVGQTVTITGSVTLKNPKAGDDTLTTAITTDTPGSNCPVGNTAAACRTSVAVLTPALSIAKSADRSTTTPGGTVGYTITATNTGPTIYTGAQVTDSLAAVLTDAVYSGNAAATRGTVALIGQQLIWTGDLEVGQQVVITYSVVVNNPDLGDKSLVNRVVSDELGSSCPTGGATAGCTSTVTVLVPALQISIAANSTTTTPGATVGYTVTVANSGETPYTAATVTAGLADVLDDAAYNHDARSTLPGAFSDNGSGLTWTGDLAVGATATLTYSVTVDAEADLGNRTLRTSVTSPDAGSTCTTGTACVNTVQVLLPRLVVSTTADVSNATPGDPVRFTITVRNSGETAYAGSVGTDLTDVVDDATFDETVTSSIGQTNYIGSVLTWTGSLSVGATATISYAVAVRAPDPGNKVMTSTVVADAAGSNCPGGSTDSACTARVTVLVPALSIDKSVDKTTTTPGGRVVYTISLQNTGQTGYTGATVVDSLSNILEDSNYNGDATVVGGGVLAYADSTLAWTGDLPIGATATITYSITVKDPDPGDKLLVNTVTSSAPGSSCPPAGNVPACTTSVQVLIPALVITKTADTAQVTAGSPVRYTITVQNTGETAYAPATFSDNLSAVADDATYAGDGQATIGTVAYANDTLVWTGPLAQDQTATITYSVTADFPAVGDRELRNVVTSSSPGANCTTGRTDVRCASSVTAVVPALAITKTADTSRVVAGGLVRYTIEATNTGQAAYAAATFSDSLVDVLDDAALIGPATASTGTLAYNQSILSWTGAMTQGASVVVSYFVRVNQSVTENAELDNAVVSTSVGSTCPPDNSVPACTTSVAVEAGVLTLTDLTPGFTLTGLPDSTVSRDNAVSMTVTTNNPGGYNVTVGATGDALQPTLTGNTDTIQIGRLRVRETGTELYYPLTTDEVTVHRQARPSAPGGDAVANDYQVEIPFVTSDTYTAELEYIVTAE